MTARGWGPEGTGFLAGSGMKFVTLGMRRDLDIADGIRTYSARAEGCGSLLSTRFGVTSAYEVEHVRWIGAQWLFRKKDSLDPYPTPKVGIQGPAGRQLNVWVWGRGPASHGGRGEVVVVHARARGAGVPKERVLEQMYIRIYEKGECKNGGF